MHRTQKTKKGLVFFLLLLIIGLSILFYFYLLNIDKKYSRIIKNETTLYNNIQDITFGANRGYLLLYKIMETDDQQKRNSLIDQKNLSVAKNDSLINKVLSSLTEKKDRLPLNELISSRQEYIQNCARFEEYLISEKKDSAQYFLINKIEPSFLTYQDELISFIDSNTTNVLENSEHITSEVKRNSSIVLLFGLSPLLIVILFLIILVVLLLIMILFLKNVEYGRYGE
ncbi:MAG: MCP four helix bundle domain-containing protein [Ignavibacteriaceae bacterium]|nr:MCP four helix bundle domain-containing protein [Ignavibacteriaceae bacterium]